MDGSQSGGTPCNKIPSGLFDPIGAQMIQLYPANAIGNGFNFSSVPVRKLDEGEFDVRVDHNVLSKDPYMPDSATTKLCRFTRWISTVSLSGTRSAALRTLRITGETSPCRKPTFSPIARSTRSMVALIVFSTRSFRSGSHLRVGSARCSRSKPGQQLPFTGGSSARPFSIHDGLHQLRTEHCSTRRSLLGTGRPRFRAFSGGHKRILRLRFVRHDPRQPQHPNRWRRPSEPNERADQRLPGWLLGVYECMDKRRWSWFRNSEFLFWRRRQRGESAAGTDGPRSSRQPFLGRLPGGAGRCSVLSSRMIGA